MKVVIFPTPRTDKSVSVMLVAPEYMDRMEDIAFLDVPYQENFDCVTGEWIKTEQVWRIVESADLPEPNYRNIDQWEWTEEGPLKVKEG